MNHFYKKVIAWIGLAALAVNLCACGAQKPDPAVSLPGGLDLGTEEETAAPTQPDTAAASPAETSLTSVSTTPAPTEPPTTAAPTTAAPPTEAPTEPPTTAAPTTAAPTEPPITPAPTTAAPPTEAPTEPPATAAPTTPAPTEPPETEPPATQPRETEPPEGKNVGLWSEVPTAEADWATRAVSDMVYTNADFGFPTYVSPYDFDGDGIEDQADILQGAKDYVATRPAYDTSYFEGGWPPAGKGTCTDVIAYALLAAGYDIQALVAKDVAMRPEAYPGPVGDSNIDYRRTRNLEPFFETYFEKLTTDPYDYEAWQPGDIVLFGNRETGMWPGHVAIVSDRRAADGLPYLIHHTDNDKYSYEQDFLTTPQRYIVGHYRVGNLKDSVLYK